MKIGFIGLGNMGGGMAANLVRAGHAVTAFDLSADALARAKGNGCSIAASIENAVREADIIVTMLPNGKIVAEAYQAHIIGTAPRAATLIDCSTIDVETARNVARDAAKRGGYEMVDAPVSGGIAAANAGTLTFMVGGTPSGFGHAEPILAAMGKAVIHAGASGAGQAAKICNNMILGATMIATCEAFAMAKKLGLDLQTFYDISSKASGQSWSMTSYCPVPGVGPQSPADNDYQGGFATNLMLKDLLLAMDAADKADAAVPMAARAAELYQEFTSLGQGSSDFSGIVKMLEASGGLNNGTLRS